MVLGNKLGSVVVQDRDFVHVDSDSMFDYIHKVVHVVAVEDVYDVVRRDCWGSVAAMAVGIVAF